MICNAITEIFLTWELWCSGMEWINWFAEIKECLQLDWQLRNNAQRDMSWRKTKSISTKGMQCKDFLYGKMDK